MMEEEYKGWRISYNLGGYYEATNLSSDEWVTGRLKEDVKERIDELETK